MKTRRTNLLVLVVLALGLGSAAALTPWVSQTTMTAATFDSRLNLWLPPPYNLAPVCLSGYDDDGTISLRGALGARDRWPGAAGGSGRDGGGVRNGQRPGATAGLPLDLNPRFPERRDGLFQRHLPAQ